MNAQYSTDVSITLKPFWYELLLGFGYPLSSDGVGVEVVIGNVELYDQVKNWVVGAASRSGRTIPIIKRGDWFILPLLLPTPTIWFSLARS